MKSQDRMSLTDNALVRSIVGIALLLGVAQIALCEDKTQASLEEILSLQADADYGEYLAGECLTCHQATGATPGVPAIVGLPTDYFITALLAYKDGSRNNNVMQLVAGNLGPDEIASLALYFSTLASK